MQPLLEGLIDYAGLFPPAALSMREVVANYASYLASPHAWMLGRLVVPASRLPECHSERSAQRGVEESAPWRVSALVADAVADFQVISGWNGIGLFVDSCEVKASTIAEIDAIAALKPAHITAFVEIPVGDDPAPLLDAIKSRGLHAKIRTGGVTTDAFPSVEQVSRFITACAERDIAFKATAGLHHPLRGHFRLTYAADAPRGTMYGFLNVFLAAVAADNQPGDLERILTETDPHALRFADPASVSRARHHLALSFGSCSFMEPVEDLQQLGLL